MAINVNSKKFIHEPASAARAGPGILHRRPIIIGKKTSCNRTSSIMDGGQKVAVSRAHTYAGPTTHHMCLLFFQFCFKVRVVGTYYQVRFSVRLGRLWKCNTATQTATIDCSQLLVSGGGWWCDALDPYYYYAKIDPWQRRPTRHRSSTLRTYPQICAFVERFIGRSLAGMRFSRLRNVDALVFLQKVEDVVQKWLNWRRKLSFINCGSGEH